MRGELRGLRFLRQEVGGLEVIQMTPGCVGREKRVPGWVKG